jgi:HPr kinase/phosphorylase
VLLLGPSGIGKSDLLLRLLDRGFDLVADDRVEIADGMARPPPALAGLIEVRGLGLLRMAHTAPVHIALAVVLGPDEPRLPAPSRHRELDVPQMRINARRASAAQVVSLALDCATGRRSLLAGAFEGPDPTMAADPAQAGP